MKVRVPLISKNIEALEELAKEEGIDIDEFLKIYHVLNSILPVFSIVGLKKGKNSSNRFFRKYLKTIGKLLLLAIYGEIARQDIKFDTSLIDVIDKGLERTEKEFREVMTKLNDALTNESCWVNPRNPFE